MLIILSPGRKFLEMSPQTAQMRMNNQVSQQNSTHGCYLFVEKVLSALPDTYNVNFLF